jgi:hypothetical protein
MAKVPLAGTDYIPGVSVQRTRAEIQRLVERALPHAPVPTTSEPAPLAGD